MTDIVQRLREGIYWNGALREAEAENEALRAIRPTTDHHDMTQAKP